MNRKLILIVTFVVLAAIAMLTQKRVAHSATSTIPLAPAPAEFTASTDKTFDQLLGDSMSVMWSSRTSGSNSLGSAFSFNVAHRSTLTSAIFDQPNLLHS